MNNNEFDYYRIGSESYGDVPLMIEDAEQGPSSADFLYKYTKVSPEHIVYITFNPTISIAKPRLVDAMSFRGDCCVFSKKIYDALSKHDIKGLQLVPTIIRGKNDEEFNDFWMANIYQELALFDEEKSEFGRISKVTGAWKNIKKIVLDKVKLVKVPLEDRLVFVSKENCAFIFYHKSVVDIIMSANPEGIVFTPVEEWYDGVQFDR